MDSDLQALNDQYHIPGHIAFTIGQNNILTAQINNQHAAASITLAGAHVMSYMPHGEPQVLWLSPNSAHKLGVAMRGGVPICWPWFARHSTDPQNKPMHGFVRTMLWAMSGARALPDGATEVRMIVHDTPETRAIWPHAFELEAIITVGKKLRVEWVARNPGTEPYTYTGALHPYYAVRDVAAITVTGLDQVDYLDKTEDFRRKTQVGPITFTRETDRIYLGTTTEITIDDPGLRRRIHIAKEGSRTTVVWNPGPADARMPDVGAGQHHGFVCVEAANAVEDVVAVAPGAEARLAMIVWTEQGATA